jgi:hypothetical protein
MDGSGFCCPLPYGEAVKVQKVKTQQEAQFDLTLDQQSKQMEKLRDTLAQTRSYEPSEFWQMGDNPVMPWKFIVSHKRRYNEELLHLCHILFCWS